MLLHMEEGGEEGEAIRRGKYGLGDRRSFAQLMEFSGVDPIHRVTTADRYGSVVFGSANAAGGAEGVFFVGVLDMEWL